MKAVTMTQRKQRQPAGSRPEKPCCGTLSYIAECRGVVKKTRTFEMQAPGVNRIVRKYSF